MKHRLEIDKDSKQLIKTHCRFQRERRAPGSGPLLTEPYEMFCQSRMSASEEELTIMDLLKEQVPRCLCHLPSPARLCPASDFDPALQQILTFVEAVFQDEDEKEDHTSPPHSTSNTESQTCYGISLNKEVTSALDELTNFIQSQVSPQQSSLPSNSHEKPSHIPLSASSRQTQLSSHIPSPQQAHLIVTPNASQSHPPTPNLCNTLATNPQELPGFISNHQKSSIQNISCQESPDISLKQVQSPLLSHYQNTSISASPDSQYHQPSPKTPPPQPRPHPLELEFHPSPSNFFEETQKLCSSDNLKCDQLPQRLPGVKTEPETTKDNVLKTGPGCNMSQEIKAASGSSKGQMVKAVPGPMKSQKVQAALKISESQGITVASGSSKVQEIKTASEYSQGQVVKAVPGPRKGQNVQAALKFSESQGITIASGSSKVQEVKTALESSKGQVVKAVPGPRKGQKVQAALKFSESQGINVASGSSKVQEIKTASESIQGHEVKIVPGPSKGQEVKSASESSEGQEIKTLPGPSKGQEVKESKGQEIKPYLIPFVSVDEQENKDNEDPQWKELASLRTDEERYRMVHKLWRTPCVPDPNTNLTMFTHDKLQADHSPSSDGGRLSKKHRFDAEDELEPPKKRQKFEDVFFSIQQINKSKYMVMKEYEQGLETNLSRHDAKKLENSYLEKQHMLDLACEEVTAIQEFYHGMPDQDSSVTQAAVERGYQAMEHVYDVFRRVYGYNGQEFFP